MLTNRKTTWKKNEIAAERRRMKTRAEMVEYRPQIIHVPVTHLVA